MTDHSPSHIRGHTPLDRGSFANTFTGTVGRGRNIVGLLTLGDDVTARKLLGMAQRPLRSKALDRAWELERRSGAAEQTHAN
jgi:hypothetical protein